MTTSEQYTFGELLKQFRIRVSLTQQELAQRTEVHRNTINGWEQGNYLPRSRAHVHALADALQLDEQEIARLFTAGFFPRDGEPQNVVGHPPAPLLSPLWNVPYQRNPHFTGRDDLLERLAHQLSSENSGDVSTTRRAMLSQPQAVKGLGGIGKTQIAVEYAYRAREKGRYTHTFWINAAGEEALLTSFQMLAEQLPNFPTRNEKDRHKLIAAILRWLEACPAPWLLIVDNADELPLVQPYLPQQGQGSILLTTRAHAVSWLAASIEVEQMGLVEGTRFVLHRSGRLSASEEEYNEATNVVIALDGFPLALDQAGAYIEETGCSFRDYLQLYEQHRATLLARRGKQANNYPASVATTWDLSFQQIEQTQPAATELLHLCAYLSPDHIPEELITQGATHWPSLLQEAVSDALRFNDLLEALLAFSLVKRLVQERQMSLHRLVQAVHLDRIEPEVQRQWAERVVRAVNGFFPADPKEQIETWPQCLRYLEQVQACDGLIQRYRLQMPEAADLLERAGSYLGEHASYDLAKSLFERALGIAEQALGPEHLQVAYTLNNLGTLYCQQGKYEQAEPLYQRALHIWEQALGPEHPQLAHPLNNLGILYCQQGKYEQAEPLYQRALHIWEQALGPEHPQLAYPLNNLGILYKRQGKYEQAEPLYQRALHIREQTLGSEHPQLAYPLNNLGELYYEQGKYEQAEPLYQRALHIREQSLGQDHPQLAYPLNNLGELYYEQGKYEQAEPLYQRALHIWEQAVGQEYPQLAYPLNGLANLSRDQGQYRQADALYQRTLTLRQQHLGPQHPEVAETLHDLARLRVLQRHLTEALPLYQQALAIRERALGPRHPKTMATRTAYMHLLQEMGQTEARSDSHSEVCQAEETRSPLHQAAYPSSAECDPLRGFLNACCELHPHAWCRSADIWQAYEQWVVDYQERYPLSRGAFIAQLKAHGCRAGRINTARIWRGIALVNEEQ